MITENLDVWLIVSFAAAFVPACILLVLYGLRTRFWGSGTGWAFFWLIATTVASYGLSLVALVWDDWATSDVGYIVRTLSRFAIAAVLWNLLRVFLVAQRNGNLDGERERVHGSEER